MHVERKSTTYLNEHRLIGFYSMRQLIDIDKIRPIFSVGNALDNTMHTSRAADKSINLRPSAPHRHWFRTREISIFIKHARTISNDVHIVQMARHRHITSNSRSYVHNNAHSSCTTRSHSWMLKPFMCAMMRCHSRLYGQRDTKYNLHIAVAPLPHQNARIFFISRVKHILALKAFACLAFYFFGEARRREMN